MKIRILAVLLLFASLPVWAQDGLSLGYQLLSMQSVGNGTQLNFRFVLSNNTTHQYHDIRLQMQDVALSLATEAPMLEFHTLGAGNSKYRFLTITSNLNYRELQHTGPLLFHFQALDENGTAVNHLLRSHEAQP